MHAEAYTIYYAIWRLNFDGEKKTFERAIEMKKKKRKERSTRDFYIFDWTSRC